MLYIPFWPLCEPKPATDNVSKIQQNLCLTALKTFTIFQKVLCTSIQPKRLEFSAKNDNLDHCTML